MGHIARSDFLEFFTTPNRALHARVAGHLLDGCPACLERAGQVLLDLGVPHPSSSSRVLAIVLQDQAGLLKEERTRAAVRWARLADLEEKKRLAAVKKVRGLRNHGLAAFVLDEADSLAARGKFAKAAELVRLSAAVGDLLPARVYGAGPLADLRLRQHVTLGNIKRIELDFPSALHALEKAEPFRDKGIDPAERARFYRVKTTLLGDLGDYEEAAKAAGRTVGLYEGMLDLQNKGTAIVDEAQCVMYFDLHTALGLAAEALPLLATAPKPLLLANFTKCYCLAKLDQSQEAEILLSSQRELIRQVAVVEIELWFKYVEALILKAKGKPDDADALLSFVALRFREEGNLLAMLVQHLERIRIKVETGRWKSALNIAIRLTPELARLGLRNDLLSMWATLQDALVQRRDVVSEIENLFRRRWNTPGLLARR